MDEKKTVIRSVSDNQSEILRSIMTLRGIDRFDVDVTYGSGGFYKTIPEPRMKFDIDPQRSDVSHADSTNLPLEAKSVNSLVFDPPFLTYVRQGRAGNGKMVMSQRFGGYWRYDELENHYQATLTEAARVLRKGGTLVAKVQDIVHNHRLHTTHTKTIEWAEHAGFRLEDLFILIAKHRLPSPNKQGEQRHARIFHSYFLVFEKK